MKTVNTSKMQYGRNLEILTLKIANYTGGWVEVAMLS